MNTVTAVESRLKKWLGSQEPINNLFKKKIYCFKDYLTEDYLEPTRQKLFSQYGKQVLPIVEDVLKHLHPVVLFTQTEFQSVSDQIFKLNGIVFAGDDIYPTLYAADQIFAHIISAGIEIDLYSKEHPDFLTQKVIHELCKASNHQGFNLVVKTLIEDYDTANFMAFYPGEPGWSLAEGHRIFELFENYLNRFGLYMTEIALPNVSYTAYGLITSNE